MKGISLFTLRLICLLLVTAAGTFTLLSFSPVDPIRAYIGSDLLHVPPEQYPLIAARWGWIYLCGNVFCIGLLKCSKGILVTRCCITRRFLR